MAAPKIAIVPGRRNSSLFRSASNSPEPGQDQVWGRPRRSSRQDLAAGERRKGRSSGPEQEAGVDPSRPSVGISKCPKSGH
jgi:hypothetical protein